MKILISVLFSMAITVFLMMIVMRNHEKKFHTEKNCGCKKVVNNENGTSFGGTVGDLLGSMNINI